MRTLLALVFVSSALVVPHTASAADSCFAVSGQVWTVYSDSAGTLASRRIFDGTPITGELEYSSTGAGLVDLHMGTARLGADPSIVVPYGGTLYSYSMAWDFTEPYGFSYGDVRFEGPSGWLDGGIPATLDAATYGWGYFALADGSDFAEFIIYLPDFVQVPCS